MDGIVSTVEAGLSDDLIIARVRKEGKPFDPSTDDMIRLKKAKVSDAVIKVMLDPDSHTTEYPASITRPAVLQPPIVPGVAAGRPSGATPCPAAETSGDPNDPVNPHDSGIYLYSKDRDGKPVLIVLQRASYQGTKTGGMLKSAGDLRHCQSKNQSGAARRSCMPARQ